MDNLTDAQQLDLWQTLWKFADEKLEDNKDMRVFMIGKGKMSGWHHRRMDVASNVEWIKQELKKEIQKDIDEREKGKLTGNYANCVSLALSLIDEAFSDLEHKKKSNRGN